MHWHSYKPSRKRERKKIRHLFYLRLAALIAVPAHNTLAIVHTLNAAQLSNAQHLFSGLAWNPAPKEFKGASEKQCERGYHENLINID